MSIVDKWNYAVYGKDAPGEVFLLKRCVGEKEAKEIADAFWHETHRTAVIVKSIKEVKE